MTHLLKPDKDLFNIDSNRPINNLCTLDKIIEEYIKTHLQDHLSINDLIGMNHHGSRKWHGTNTIIANITYECNVRYQYDTYTAVLQTDLSAAFDTVDTRILIVKLELYGIKNNELKLLTYFLTNRTQYVTIDTNDPTTQNSLTVQLYKETS